MITLYYHTSPSAAKITLFLEEAGLDYEIKHVDLRKGEQQSSEFRAINPSGRTPALQDNEVVIFDGNAILLYLADTSGRFLPAPGYAGRGELLSWLMFCANGAEPFFGRAIHVDDVPPLSDNNGTNRYSAESERDWQLIDNRLGKGRFMLGDVYTIVDMSVWAWARAMPANSHADAWAGLPNVKRLLDEINGRPASARAEAVAKNFIADERVDEENVIYLLAERAHRSNM